MKSLLIIHDYPLCEGGGVETQTYLDACHLARSGFRVTLASTRAQSETYSSEILPDTCPNLCLKYIDSNEDLRRLIIDHEIIHINATFSLRSGVIQGIRCAEQLRKQYIVFLHTSIHHVPFSRLAEIPEIERNELLVEFAGYLGSSLCTVVGVSKSMQDTLEHLSVNKEMHVVYNAKDWDTFAPLGECMSRVDITYIGEISFMKGVHILIQALYELKLSSTSCTVRIIGDGQDKDDIKAIAQSLGLMECIEFVPYMNNSAIPNAIIASRLLVVPSLTETWGNIAMESMGLGVPVVCSNCEGLIELTEGGEIGFLFDRGSVTSLANKLREVLQASELDIATIAQKASHVVRSKYAIPNRVTGLIRLYESYISNS